MFASADVAGQFASRVPKLVGHVATIDLVPRLRLRREDLSPASVGLRPAARPPRPGGSHHAVGEACARSMALFAQSASRTRTPRLSHPAADLGDY
jgi:hypothetical protein